MHGEYKVPGGKLVVVDTDVEEERLARVRVSGDFFLDPDDALTRITASLEGAPASSSAKDLAARFGVSRQVIVQDLAVIRASRPNIISTNRGYILQQQETGCLREFKVRHTPEQAGQELNLIVDHGGRVKNISISHRVYGRITAEMDIRSRQDVQEFLQALAGGASTVLSTATDGYHYHLVEAATPDRLDLIGQALQDADFLAPLQPWEKEK